MYRYRISKGFVRESLGIASLMIERCNFFIRRNFVKFMRNLVGFLALDDLIPNSERRQMLSFTRYLRSEDGLSQF